jgi:hypothetical protein
MFCICEIDAKTSSTCSNFCLHRRTNHSNQSLFIVVGPPLRSKISRNSIPNALVSVTSPWCSWPRSTAIQLHATSRFSSAHTPSHIALCSVTHRAGMVRRRPQCPRSSTRSSSSFSSSSCIASFHAALLPCGQSNLPIIGLRSEPELTGCDIQFHCLRSVSSQTSLGADHPDTLLSM